MPRCFAERKSPCERIASTFGMCELPEGLFSDFEYGLRFELGGEHPPSLSPIPRLLQALDRARSIARSLFENSKDLSAFISYYGEKCRGYHERQACLSLKALGFDKPLGTPDKIPQGDADYIAEFGNDLYRYWHCVDRVSLVPDVDTLLWASISKKMRVSPKSRWAIIHIADLNAGTLLHVVDDRGVDVVATDPASLLPLYEAFREWLIAEDRLRMDQTFEPLVRKR